MTYPVNSDRNTFLTKAVPMGVAIVAADIAWYAVDKENRADTFVKTAKKCAKVFAEDGRKNINWVLNKLKWDKGAEYISKLSNRKMFAGAFGAAVMINAVVISAIGKLLSRN